MRQLFLNVNLSRMATTRKEVAILANCLRELGQTKAGRRRIMEEVAKEFVGLPDIELRQEDGEIEILHGDYSVIPPWVEL